MSQIFNPFGKSVYEISKEDIPVLQNVSEGIYVEYKKKEITIDKISKELASFANQYGGWIVWGVQENSATKYPEIFAGLTEREINSLSQRINEASQARLSREVIYHEVKVEGPIEQIGLEKNKSILITYIPYSYNTPHINRDGKVYLRLGEQGQPKELNDINLLNDLYNRRGVLFGNINSQIVGSKTLLSGCWERNPLLEIFVTTDFEKIATKSILNYSDFKKILKEDDHEIPLDHLHPLKGGFYSKQSQRNNPTIPSVSFRWFHHNSCMMSIPLNAYSLNQLVENGYDKSVQISPYFSLSYFSKMESPFLDMNYSLLVIISFFRRYSKLLKQVGYKGNLFAVFSIRNIHNKIPFLNTNKYIKQIEQDGPPVLPINEVEFPDIRSKSDFICLDSSESSEVRSALTLLKCILEDMGVELPDENEEMKVFFDELINSFNKAV